MTDVLIPPASAAVNGFVAGNSHNHNHSNLDWPERTAERVRASVYESERARAEEVRDVLTAVEKNGAAGILATNVAAGALGVAIEKTAASTNLAIEKTAAATNLAIEKTAAAGMLLAVQNAGASALTAAQNHALALAQAAECCCEIKELVRADGEKTRDLVSSINAANLATQLVDAKQTILALRLGATTNPA